MRPIITFGAALALCLGPLALSANPGNGNGNGNGHRAGGQAGVEHGCPPGLAGREPACVPPGLARQGVTTEQWIGPVTTHYIVGDRLSPDEVVWFSDLDRYRLPALAEGQRYAVIDGTLVALDTGSYEILQLIRAVAAVGN